MSTKPNLQDELRESYDKKVEEVFDVNRKKQPRLFKWGRQALPFSFVGPSVLATLFPEFSMKDFIVGSILSFLALITFHVPGIATTTQLSIDLIANLMSSKIEYTRSGNSGGVGGLNCRQFNPDEWEEKQGNLFFDSSRWTLPSDELNGIWYFEDSITLDTDIRISFLSFSQSQMNFVVTMDGLYELTIGDGDYRRASLKVWDGKKFVYISDTQERRYIPFSDGEVKPGIDTKVFVNQDFSQLEDGSYIVTIQLAQDAFLDKERSPSKFATYEFALPKVRYEDGKTSLGLGLRAASDGSEVSAEVWCVDFIEQN